MQTARACFIGLLLLAFVAGCTSVSDVANYEGGGQKLTFQASAEAVWAALPASLERVGLEIATADSARQTLLAKGGVSAFSWGEAVAVFVRPVDARHCSVEVVSRKAWIENLTAKRWEKPIFDELAKEFPRE